MIAKQVVTVAALAALALPGLTYAANYAYVNSSGEVSMVSATNASIAIATAPNIATHSGVMLLDSADDSAVVGDSVTGL